jgi:hypothetical protein
MKDTYLRPEFNNTEIEVQLNACGAVYKKLPEKDLIEAVATLVR